MYVMCANQQWPNVMASVVWRLEGGENILSELDDDDDSVAGK